MKRLVLSLPFLVLAAGCVIRTVPVGYAPPPEPMAQPVVVAPPPAPAPAPAMQVWYAGPHFIPDAYGGGWCYEEGPHVHPYYPDRPDAYAYEGGYYSYTGPWAFVYVDGHPLPGGGWCFIRGAHTHDFYPPRGAEWQYQRDHRGYAYRGPYRPNRLPPVSYWPRPAPRPAFQRPAPAPAPAPYPAEYPAQYGRPSPAPAPAPYAYPRPVPAP
ncbi:MAG TPA: hypothetical protein VF841_08515, partial [Anaeromyxobacter sp.]